jgi:hypothetical protein
MADATTTQGRDGDSAVETQVQVVPGTDFMRDSHAEDAHLKHGHGSDSM